MKGITKSITRLFVFAISYAISCIFANQAEMFLYIHLTLSFISVIICAIALKPKDNKVSTGILFFILLLGIQVFVSGLSIILSLAFGTVLRVGMYMMYEGVSLIFIFIPAVVAKVEPNKYE